MSYEVKVKADKAEAIAEIREKLERSSAVLLTEYRGLTVSELAELRAALRKADVEYRVVKNTLTKRAADELGIDGVEALLEGPSAVAYCFGDPVAAAKALTTFAKEHQALVLKGGVLDRKAMDASQTEALAKVDPLDVSLAKICGSLQGPLAGIAGTLEAPLSRIAYILSVRGEAA